MKNIVGLMLVIACLKGCAVPGAVNSLPELGIDASLCILHTGISWWLLTRSAVTRTGELLPFPMQIPK